MAFLFKISVAIIFKILYINNMMKTKFKSTSTKALADRKYHQRIVLAEKGRGSYNRKKMESVNA